MIKKGQLSPWLVTKPGRRERARLGQRGGHNNTHVCARACAVGIARRKCPMSHTPLHLCRRGVIQKTPHFFNYLLSSIIGVITGKPGGA